MESTQKKRGPGQSSCGSCKYRRVKCVRSNGEGEACDGCIRKGIQCSMGRVEKSTHGRTGKRIETAKALYGALSPPHSTSLVFSGPETRLANNEMDETFGLELLSLYSDSSSSDPLFPPPVFDSYSLKGRFEAVGRKLSALSEEDQLTCRIVFAAASRLRPSTSTSTADPAVVSQLRISAQSHSDSQGIWRKPSASNATSLLLLSTLVGQGEINSPEAKSYLVALTAHLQQLFKQNPTVITGTKNESATGIVWTTLVYDTFSAIERQEAPVVPKQDYDRLLSRVVPDLPSVAAIRFAVQSDAWSLVNYLLLPLAAYISAGRRLATHLEQRNRAKTDPSVLDAAELMDIWTKFESVCVWGGEALQLAFEGGLLDDFSVTILRLYVNLSYGPSIFAQLAIVLHLESLPLRLFNPGMPYAPLLGSRGRFAQFACAFLRDIKNDDGNYLSILSGTAFSVSRLAAFAILWNETSAWVRECHPGGPADKLESAIFLTEALVSVSRAYPSDELAKAIRSVESEIVALNLVTGVSAPSPSVRGASPSSSTSGSRPSISRLSTWTHLLDKEERHATVYEGEGPSGLGAIPAPPTASFFSRSTPSDSSSGGPYRTSWIDTSQVPLFGATLGGSGPLAGLPVSPRCADVASSSLPHLAFPNPRTATHSPYETLTPVPPVFDTPSQSFDSFYAAELPPPLDVPPLSAPIDPFSPFSHSTYSSASFSGVSTSAGPPLHEGKFSDTFIENFMSSLVDEAGAAGPAFRNGGGGGEGGRLETGGLGASPLDGGWLADEKEWGRTAEEEGTTFGFGSSFPSTQPWST